MTNIKGLSQAEDALVDRLVKQIQAKAVRNRIRTEFYEGKNRVALASDVIPSQYQHLAPALGWAAKAVDGLSRRTVIEQFTGSVELDSLDYKGFAQQNYLKSELAQARTDSLLHGVSFLVVTPGAVRSRIFAKSALEGTGDWNARELKLDNFLSVQKWGNAGTEPESFILYLPGITVSVQRTGGGWSVEREAHNFGVPVRPLVYRPRSSRRFGHSRITRPVMYYQAAAGRALLRIEPHMDTVAIPQLWMLGVDPSVFGVKSSAQAIMGRLLAIPDDVDAPAGLERPRMEQVAAQSPEPHIAELNMLAKLMARETSLPDSDFALADFAQPTSEGSYIQGREDLIAEAEGAEDDWGPSIAEAVALGLAMHNGETSVPDDWNLETQWRDPRYLSRSAQADAGAKQVAAMGGRDLTRVELDLLGLTPKQIEDYLAQKRTVTGRNIVEAVLNANGTADAGSNVTSS